jgi:hypothetical protein
MKKELKNFDYCDNVDCKKGNKIQRLYLVKMKKEFEGGEVWWCKDCINKDKDMTEHPNIKAIRILEFIADQMGKPKMFDGDMWYNLEDGIMEIINEENEIVIPIYWTETDKGKILIDEESMEDEFKEKLKAIDPKKLK